MVSGSGVFHLPPSLSNACKPVQRLQKVQVYSFTLQTSSSCVKVVVRWTVGEEYTLYIACLPQPSSNIVISIHKEHGTVCFNFLACYNVSQQK